jgi:hypothetical protein
MGAFKMEWRIAKEMHGFSPFFTSDDFLVV